MAKAKTKVSKKKATKKAPVKKKLAKKAVAKKVAKKKIVTKKKVTGKKTPGKKKPAAVKKKVVKKKIVKKAKKKAPVIKKVAKKKAVPKKKVATKKTAAKTAQAANKESKTPTKKVTKPKPVKKAKSAATSARRSTPAPAPRPRIVRKIVNLEGVKISLDYKPSVKEGYMSPKHLAYFKRKLDSWRDDLITESQETLEHLRTETRDVGDEAERASRESDNILELRTRDRYRKLLRKIEEALKRVEEGVYGYCEETGEEIGLGRLEARPIATLTVDAQERREMFQKQFRDDR